MSTRTDTKPGTTVDYQRYLDCVHCGLCTSACPTYVELGTEMDSPRGRIYLMRAVADGRIPLDNTVQSHLDLCLDCRACETACPSGVQYGTLIESFRSELHNAGIDSTSLPRWQRFVLFHIFPHAGRTRWATFPARWMQALRIDRFLRFTGLMSLMPRRMRQMQEMLPMLPLFHRRIPEFLPPRGQKRATVAFFTGCVADVLFNQTNWATVNVLQENGCEVWTPRNQVCCGALHHHSGMEEPASGFAKANAHVFLGRSIDAIVTNVAGCGAMLKEYSHLLPGSDDATKFTSKVRDVSEFLSELGPRQPAHALPIKATYHDACHLCHAQQIRAQPRELLGLIPELELVPLDESEICCGAAGSYNLTQPEMAERLGERKTEHILKTECDAVFTANAGCLMQIARHLKVRSSTMWTAHPMDALWASYSGVLPPSIKNLTP